MYFQENILLLYLQVSNSTFWEPVNYLSSYSGQGHDPYLPLTSPRMHLEGDFLWNSQALLLEAHCFLQTVIVVQDDGVSLFTIFSQLAIKTGIRVNWELEFCFIHSCIPKTQVFNTHFQRQHPTPTRESGSFIHTNMLGIRGTKRFQKNWLFLNNIHFILEIPNNHSIIQCLWALCSCS